MIYRGFNIERQWVTREGRPQPNEFTWVHPDYDGPEDRRCGAAPTLAAAREAIDELLEER